MTASITTQTPSNIINSGGTALNDNGIESQGLDRATVSFAPPTCCTRDIRHLGKRADLGTTAGRLFAANAREAGQINEVNGFPVRQVDQSAALEICKRAADGFHRRAEIVSDIATRDQHAKSMMSGGIAWQMR